MSILSYLLKQVTWRKFLQVLRVFVVEKSNNRPTRGG